MMFGPFVSSCLYSMEDSLALVSTMFASDLLLRKLRAWASWMNEHTLELDDLSDDNSVTSQRVSNWASTCSGNSRAPAPHL